MGSAIVPDECFKTNPPELPIDRLRAGTLSHVEAVRLGAASARADSFTYGEPFRMFAVALDRAADHLGRAASLSLAVQLSEAIEAYLVEKYGDPPVIPDHERGGDQMLDIWLAIHGDVA